MAWWDDPQQVAEYRRIRSELLAQRAGSGQVSPTPALSSVGAGTLDPAPSYFEDPLGNLQRGVDYFRQDIGQHLGKPFPEAATGIAGALANAGLDVLSFIPREVSPVAVESIRTGTDPFGASPTELTQLKRGGEQFREGLVEQAAIPDFDIGPLEIRMDTLPAEILYDTFTDPTIWIAAGLTIPAKVLRSAGLRKAAEWTAMAPGLPFIAPLKGMGAALKASGLTKLSKRGENYHRSLVADRTTKELELQFGNFLPGLPRVRAINVLPGLPDVQISKGWLADKYLDPGVSLSQQGRKYLEQEHIRPIADKFFRNLDTRFDENARQSLLADIGRAEQKDQGLSAKDAGFGLKKLWDGMNQLWKEAWLPLNPSYHAANTLDNTVKSLFYGLVPWRHRNLAENLGLGPGIERTRGFGLTITQLPEGKGLLPFSRWGTAKSETIEGSFRVMAYNKSLGDDWAGIRNSFLVDAERRLVAAGADPAQVQALTRQLRHMDFSGKDFIEEFRHLAGEELPAHIRFGDVDFPGYEGLLRSLRADLKAGTANLDDYLRRADVEADDVRQAFASKPDYGTGQAFGESVRDMLQAAEQFPDGTAALQVLLTVREMGRVHSILANAARALPKSEQVMGWNHFRDLADELGQLGQDVAATIKNSADLAPTHGPLVDDIVQTTRTVQDTILKHTSWARTKAAWDEMGGSYGAAKREKDRRIFEEVGALIGGFVGRHKNTWAEYENLTHMTDFSVLKQYGESMEALLGRKMGERTGHLDDAAEMAEDFKEWLTIKFQELGPVTSSTARALNKDVGNTLRQLGSELQTEINKMDDRAVKFTGDVFFNYGARTNLDGLLSLLSPFTVWQTRNIPWYIQHMAASPGGRALTRQVRDYVDKTEGEREERGLTQRFERTARIGQIGETELRADAMKTFLSVATQVDQPFILSGGDEPEEGEERLGPQGATPVGAAIQTFLRLMGGISLYPQIYLPLQAAGAFGETPVSDILPASRAYRGLRELSEEIFGQKLPDIDPEGHIFQPGVRAVGQALSEANLPFIPGVEQTSVTGNIFIDGNIRRRIAEKGREQGLDEPTMLRAMNDPESQLWLEAQDEVERESGLVSGARFLFPMSVKTLSPGEASLREAKGRLPRKPAGMSYEDWKKEDQYQTRLELLEADPGLSAYLKRFDHPAVRELSAEFDEFYSLDGGDPAALARLNATESGSEERKELGRTDKAVQRIYKARDEYVASNPEIAGYFDRDEEQFPTVRDYVQGIPEGDVAVAGQEAAGLQQRANELSAAQGEFAALKTPQYDFYGGLSKGQKTAFIKAEPEAYQGIVAARIARFELALDKPILAQWYAYRNNVGWDTKVTNREFMDAWQEKDVPREDEALAFIREKLKIAQETLGRTAQPRKLPNVREFRPLPRPRVYRGQR